MILERKKRILLFANTEHNAECVGEHIRAIQAGSPDQWFVVNSLTNRLAHKIDLNFFDAVGFHYSIHPQEKYYCSNELKQKVSEFGGVVFQFLQDEYLRVHLASQAMADIGTDLLFTIVRPELHNIAYDHPGLNQMRRVTVLAGYAPKPRVNPEFIPIQDRKIDLFYRSRVCPLCSGSLGYEKSLIAKEVSHRAPQFGLKIDVSVREEDRLYGQDWVRAMSSCRATLGSESGASIWDRDGTIERLIDEEMGKSSGQSFEALLKTVLKPYDGKLIYSSISPRVFEAAALKTPQILFPGWYNGLIKPGLHFLQLEKDFSNFSEIVNALRNDELLSNLAENAYRDLIASEKYTDRVLGDLVHENLTELIQKKGFVPKSLDSENLRRNLQINWCHLPFNGVRNLQAECELAISQFVEVVQNPRFRGLRKLGRMFELLKRYLTHLAPRISMPFKKKMTKKISQPA